MAGKLLDWVHKSVVGWYSERLMLRFQADASACIKHDPSPTTTVNITT
jgi:hypothetical protein